MSRTRETVIMGIGILAGLALSGPAAQAATNITAMLSSQPSSRAEKTRTQTQAYRNNVQATRSPI